VSRGWYFFVRCNALAHHVDRPHQLAPLGRVVGHDLGQVKLANTRLAKKAAADFLGAVVPESWVKPGIAPADRAVALNIAYEIRL